MSKLRQRLTDSVLVFDGAMGTEIYKRDFFVNTSFDGLNLAAPDVIRKIHESYVEAGADILTTNTFAANHVALAKFGLGEKTREVNVAAVDIARSAAGPNMLVAGSIGPIPRSRHGFNAEPALDALAEQLELLEGAGVDFVIFETIHSSAESELAFKAANIAGSLPYMMSFSVDREGRAAKGEPLESLLKPLESEGRRPDALGLNCCVGPEGLLTPLEKLLAATDLPVVAQPNAGMPKQVGGRMIYMASPEYFATYALRFVNMGAASVGGCCGTGPEHIAEIAKNVKRAVIAVKRSEKTADPVADVPEVDPAPTAEKSKLGAKIAAGEWVATIEITPPKGYDLGATLEKARCCRDARIDAINIPDGPRASSRISPLVTSMMIQNEVGIEAVLHFCCRDRNLIGMQSDLLGCAAAGIANILFITGDPPKVGHYPDASAVFDADSIGMVRFQNRLNRGIDIGGNPIPAPTKALIGVGADPNAIDMTRELRRTREKVEAGAEFIITQPVFSVGSLFSFLDAIEDLNVPVIAGIWPLASYRNAEFMRNEVPGVVVPDEIMERMERRGTKEEQRAEGIAIARETLTVVRSRVAGVQVSAPFGNVETALAVANQD